MSPIHRFHYAGNLSCRYIIHAVGPRWGEGDEQANLSSAVEGALKLADRLKLRSIVLPALSTGIFGFPRPLAARVILSAIQDYVAENPSSSLHLVRLVLFDQETTQAFLETWDQNDHFRS